MHPPYTRIGRHSSGPSLLECQRCQLSYCLGMPFTGPHHPKRFWTVLTVVHKNCAVTPMWYPGKGGYGYLPCKLLYLNNNSFIKYPLINGFPPIISDILWDTTKQTGTQLILLNQAVIIIGCSITYLHLPS